MSSTYEYKLPELGEGVFEGEIVKWLVKPGDDITEDQGLVEIMTDKATTTVPSPRRGKVVKTFGKEGEMARVHHPLVLLELDTAPHPDDAAHAPAAAPAQGDGAGRPAAPSPAPPAAGPAPGEASGQRVLATPLVRRMAREHGLDLAGLHGSGAQGRVMKVDVMAALEGGAREPEARPARAPAAAARSAPPAPLERTQGDERIPLKGLRRKIAEKMVRSKQSMPHFTFVEEVDATELVAMRRRINESLAAAGDSARLTFLPFITKAVVAALKRFPQVNANFDEAAQELVVRRHYNIGIAVATPEGLTVPVVHGADRLPLRELAAEVARLGSAARERKLRTEELQGGTFTITSLGQTGGLMATPIINHPEVAILGVHRLRKRPAVRGDQVVVREMMNLSLSCDHRVVDGALGAEFTYEVVKYLETPELLLLEMA